jgi:hypothetical protein
MPNTPKQPANKDVSLPSERGLTVTGPLGGAIKIRQSTLAAWFVSAVSSALALMTTSRIGPSLLGHTLTITGPSGREIKIRWSTPAIWLVLTVIPGRALASEQRDAEVSDD